MNKYLLAATVSLICGFSTTSSRAAAEESLVLENERLGLCFDRKTGTLTTLDNNLTGETYRVSGDEFAIEAVKFRLDLPAMKLAALELQDGTSHVRYQGGEMTVEVTYTLAGQNHFAEKQMFLTSNRDYGLKRVVLSRATFSVAGLNIVSYRYPQFGRSPGTEPLCTYFGRTAKGGFFTGIEMPFAASSLSGPQVTLAYAPSLKVKAGEKLVCEPVYFGVYRRRATDDLPPAHPPIRGTHGQPQLTMAEVLPMPSESDAMVAMTSAILGPPRHGLVPMACGWHCEMAEKK